MAVYTIRASKRFAVRLPVTLKAGRSKRDGLMIELSSEGARISCLGDASYDVGDSVCLHLDEDRKMPGTIRWAHDGLAGVKLDRALHVSELEALKQVNREANRPDAGEIRAYG